MTRRWQCLFLTVAVMFFVTGCFEPRIVEKVSADVRMHITCNDRDRVGFLENNRPDTVMVRQVWCFHGETTQAVFPIPPHGRYDVPRHGGTQTGWHIFDQNGREIGWLDEKE